jgi:penicillin-binding protein 2
VGISGHSLERQDSDQSRMWHSMYLYVFGCIFLVLLFVGVVNLQVVNGEENAERSIQNRLDEIEVNADRGVIYDRNGKKLAINVPSFNVILNPSNLDRETIESRLTTLSEIVQIPIEQLISTYTTVFEKDPYQKRILLAQDVSRDQILEIRSHTDDLEGVEIEYSSKRSYLDGLLFSHLIGYTGLASEAQIEERDDLGLGDIVGQEGIEYQYDERLQGEKGKKIVEVDAQMNILTEFTNEGTAPIPGDSVYLSIDAEAQRKMYDLLTVAVTKYGATGGAAILEDVHTGELLVALSVPSYDNNLFVGGISQDDYNTVAPNLFNRFIGAQVPPGSMFKTIVASAALQEGAITKDTVFVSTGVIYFSAGYPFQEYHQTAYGPLNLIGGIAKSSNIYFCKTMLELGIDRFVPYAEFFGIGSQTGIDLPGEGTGRVPSPENKIALAETSPWLDPIWYPEGDTCNSAIGQGITTVTPIQVANWAAIIANGGKVLKPRLTEKWQSADGKTVETETVVVREGKVDDSNLALVREGMRNAASGPMSTIFPFRNTKIAVAGKTGTAEFGVKDEKGSYTKSHAWVMGFFPYDDPKYSFTVFLEGGGESYNSAIVAADFINWWADNR